MIISFQSLDADSIHLKNISPALFFSLLYFLDFFHSFFLSLCFSLSIPLSIYLFICLYLARSEGHGSYCTIERNQNQTSGLNRRWMIAFPGRLMRNNSCQTISETTCFQYLAITTTANFCSRNADRIVRVYDRYSGFPRLLSAIADGNVNVSRYPLDFHKLWRACFTFRIFHFCRNVARCARFHGTLLGRKKNMKTRLAIEILWGSGYANGAEVRIAHTTHLRVDPPPRALPLGKIPFRFSPEVSLACCNLSCVIYLSCSTACRMNSSCSIVSTISPAVFAPARAAKTA